MRVDEVVEKLRSVAADVLPATPVVIAYLFGSRARGTARADSDIDVAVLLSDDVPRERYLDVQLAVADVLSRESRLPNVDLVVLNDAPLTLRGRAVQEGQLLYSTDEPLRAEMESRTFREFGDFKIWMAELDRELLVRHARGER